MFCAMCRLCSESVFIRFDNKIALQFYLQIHRYLATNSVTTSAKCLFAVPWSGLQNLHF